MNSNYVRKDEQIKLITECRQSGLSDYQWCKTNGIHPGNFYNWVSKLKKAGYTFPDSESKNKGTPIMKEVVKVNPVEHKVSTPAMIGQNISLSASENKASVAAELLLGDITLRLYNGADSCVIQNILQCIGGKCHAW